MKVLFAVNDENISASIVKKYQKQYKEIISYKNVYYFNAILKELQKNKSYDRVVISEDLEEFTSSSYEQKDKFIFNRLDSISDEAVSTNGSDIPIILICSERRHKVEDILVKLFGIGIYNAILGDDRTFEEVCRLINKPRSKKEAKLYYKIDTDDVNYEKGNESDVKEEEMQNILMHFKRLGKNEDRYIESFQNIVSQYNDEQLKVIIAVLPSNVKAVLEQYSKDYQRIVYRGKKKPNSADTELNSKTQSTSRRGDKRNSLNEKLLDIESQTMMSKPVVVPTTMEKNIYKKVNPRKKIELDDIEDIEEDDDIPNTEQIIKETPKKRGRPRKNKVVEEEIKKEPKRRGRPRKNPNPVEMKEEDEPEEQLNMLPGFEDEEELEEDNKVSINDKKYNDIEDDIEDESELYSRESSYNSERTDNKYSYQNNNYNEEDEDDYQEDEYQEDDEDDQSVDLYNLNRREKYKEQTQLEQYDNVFEDGEFESLLSQDKKVMTFVGTSKNGTSFIVNNIAQILSNMGINTAILDATKNKNAYYIYTNNDEDLRKTAVMSIKNLTQGTATGIKVNNNLTVYTDIPSQYNLINNSRPILDTLIRNHSAILIDCDFNTPVEYFEKAQEIYLIQSMDVLTIQPLTEFLRELKVKGVLYERKIRIILNKLLKLRKVDSRSIIGGMSKYNDPEMSFMTEIFDRNVVKEVAQIPFDEDVYIKYLQDVANCEMDNTKYPKEFKARLNSLAGIIYPLLSSNISGNKKMRKGQKGGYNNYSDSFSSDMNNTLNNMRQKY